jgi:hypothetical protein
VDMHDKTAAAPQNLCTVAIDRKQGA